MSTPDYTGQIPDEVQLGRVIKQLTGTDDPGQAAQKLSPWEQLNVTPVNDVGAPAYAATQMLPDQQMQADIQYHPKAINYDAAHMHMDPTMANDWQMGLVAGHELAHVADQNRGLDFGYASADKRYGLDFGDASTPHSWSYGDNVAKNMLNQRRAQELYAPQARIEEQAARAAGMQMELPSETPWELLKKNIAQ